MGLWDRVTRAMALEPWEHPASKELSSTLEEKVTALRLRQGSARPWRPSSIREALGVPAIYQALTLISNTVGTFTLRAYKNGELVPDAQRPSLIVRPNPFSTPRDFLRETAWSMGSRGEVWWWQAARDNDGMVISLIPVPTYEVRVEGTDWLKPTVYWRDRNKTSDMRQLVLNRELGDMRGKGPLQWCGAAISAAVESQEWAANFYATGGNPPIVIHSEEELTPEEALALKDKWTETPPNMPQVTSGPVDVKDLHGGMSEGTAQMLDSRNWNAGEAARMFGIPGALLEYSRGGSSLTYANIATLFDQFVRGCLIPNYLEPIEQAMSDMLPRNWTAKFNVDAILRADIKTRFEVYQSGLASGVYLDPSEPRAIEGLAGANVENAPVPYSPPAALPFDTPIKAYSREWRCDKCGRKLADMRGSGTAIKCRCGEMNAA